MKKYCPNCLRECNKSRATPNGDGFGCDPCQILWYNPNLLLDSSEDKRGSINYRLKEYLKKYLSYANDETMDEIVKRVYEITNTL